MAAPQVKRKACERIENAADRMVRKLLEIASDTTVSDAVRLAPISASSNAPPQSPEPQP
jgi:hypothetical protein